MQLAHVFATWWRSNLGWFCEVSTRWGFAAAPNALGASARMAGTGWGSVVMPSMAKAAEAWHGCPLADAAAPGLDMVRVSGCLLSWLGRLYSTWWSFALYVRMSHEVGVHLSLTLVEEKALRRGCHHARGGPARRRAGEQAKVEQARARGGPARNGS